jgi:hypothetical protein
VHARAEDTFRTGKDCGIGKYPSASLAMNKAWQAAALTAATLLAWLRLLALDGALARAEPKTRRYRILHAAARLTRGSRKRHLRIQASWPWATDSPLTMNHQGPDAASAAGLPRQVRGRGRPRPQSEHRGTGRARRTRDEGLHDPHPPG